MFIRGIFIAFCALIFGQASGQEVAADRQSWDFGEVTYWNNDTAWFKLRNGASRTLIFLPTFYKEEYQVLYSNRAVEPGQTLDVGIVYYTTERGRFDVQIPLYFNLRPDPIVFTLKGNIKGFDPSAQLRCPIVNAGREENRIEKLVTMEVRDRETDAVLEPNTIWVKTRDNHKVPLEHYEQGFRMKVFPGAYKVNVTKAGYDEYLALITLEPYQNHFVVYLDKSTEPEVVAADTRKTDTFPDRPDPKPSRNRDEPKTDDPGEFWLEEDSAAHTHHDTMPVKPAKPEQPARDSTLLDSRVYAWNNVILVVDISASMKRENKLTNLKSGISTLIDALREGDKVGLVSLSSNAELIQSPVFVTKKDSLKYRVNHMTASGATNGGAALQMAYSLARTHFMEGGNNQIIIATDGLFSGGNLSRRDMEKMIAEANKAGIHLSTIGLGADPRAMEFLSKLSALGGGDFLQILDPDTANSGLLNMIKTQSKRP
ncbi:MAG: VWA domain-containing protein [Bacteroidia bacterium]|nr:VWA domain-containing protein [Bacteroidia bacterium]